MRAPVSWIRDYADLPSGVPTVELARRLTALGLKLEAITEPGSELTGPLVVGRVLAAEPEPQKNGKTIRWCQVDVGDGSRGIVCGAANFVVGDLVVVALPGAVLPGGFEIAARKTYGHLSDGMICSAHELALGDDHTGILVLDQRHDDAVPGADAAELLYLRDSVIEFEINPDRGYALSLRGVAREAALAYDVAYRDPADRTLPRPNDSGYPVVLEDPGCPVFVTRTVTGFEAGAPTPPWLARRVQLAGMRPISLAVDVTNYVMLELGQPIHGYDGDRLAGPIRVRRARLGERLTTLDGIERNLSAEDLLITDDSGPIGLAGVMGGQTTELSEPTSTVVIEAAHFDPVTVYRTEKRHRLLSEASKRFVRGVDPLLPAYAADRVAELLVAHGGGRIHDGVTYAGSPPSIASISVDAGLPARVTGMAVDTETTITNLQLVGCAVGVDGLDKDKLTVLPPSWRPDLTDPFDLVEEVARIVGYTEIPSVLPVAPAGRGLTKGQRLRRRVGYLLAGLGLVEVKTFPFLGIADFDALGLPAGDLLRDTIRVANPLSEEAPELATTLLPALLRAAARNRGRGTTDVALFETASVFFPTRDRLAAPIFGVDWRPDDADLDKLMAAIPLQPRFLAAVLSGEISSSGWWGEGRPATWADAVQVVREVAHVLGLEVTVAGAARAPWHPGRCALVLLDGAEVGHAGELHPAVCTAYGVAPRTCALELDLDALVEAAPELVLAPRFSTYPVAKEDVALVVPADLPAATLAATLREGAGELCESVRLFDVYTGAQIGNGQKSLAFAMRFRAPDRTLTEAESGAARDRAVAMAGTRHGAVQR
ncbi:MAG: phenylalanine--tRNA ligase subunit beta [Actinomycetota bacterium]|nr:phenylalanine--tRNA ligase subunit beta [Actinomycetota bacterium]